MKIWIRTGGGLNGRRGRIAAGLRAGTRKEGRRPFYLEAWRKLRDRGMIYPCTCSRKDVAQAAGAPNGLDDEPVYPGLCRPQGKQRSFAPPGRIKDPAPHEQAEAAVSSCVEPAGVNWRFRVPDGEEICFTDLHLGLQRMVADAILETL